MNLVNQNQGRINFKRGDDFVVRTIEVLHPITGAALPTVGYTVDFKMSHVETGESAAGLVTSAVDESVGVYKVFAARANTQTWRIGDYEWDVSVIDSNNIKLSGATGRLKVTRGVD